MAANAKGKKIVPVIKDNTPVPAGKQKAAAMIKPSTKSHVKIIK